MLCSLVDISETEPLTAEFLVVGGGAVGMAVGVALARRGRSVILLEAGDVMVTAASQRYFENARPASRKLPGLHLGRFRTLGGSTNFWGGQLAEFDPIVFEPRPWASADSGWPISKSDLDAYYAGALRLLGMAHSITPDQLIMQRLGIDGATLSDDLALFFTRWVPEPNFKNLFAADIRERANLRVLINAPVVGLLRSPQSAARLSGAQAVDAAGRRRTIRARTVILANGTIEIARLLCFAFADGTHTPWADNRWLGRGFMDHLDINAGEVSPDKSRNLHRMFDNAILDGIKYQPKLKLTETAQRREELLGIACHLVYKSSLSEDVANAKIFVKGFLRGRIRGSIGTIPRQLAALLRVGGPMLLRYIRYRRVYSPTDGGIHLRLTSEQRCNPESRLRLTDQLDDLGSPIAEIDWKVDGAELETFARFAQLLPQFFADNDLGSVRLDPRLAARDPGVIDEAEDTNHQMGMARMAGDPDHGVVDANLKVFGSDNLYVAGAAVYPSTGFANPTFTAIALGLRLVDFMERTLC